MPEALPGDVYAYFFRRRASSSVQPLLFFHEQRISLLIVNSQLVQEDPNVFSCMRRITNATRRDWDPESPRSNAMHRRLGKVLGYGTAGLGPLGPRGYLALPRVMGVTIDVRHRTKSPTWLNVVGYFEPLNDSKAVLAAERLYDRVRRCLRHAGTDWETRLRTETVSA